ncbi:MAG TPA: cytochrome c oxidase subunit II [Steroidobacteraceae bacterium]|nr:cytochrome c oxidase subunit II [Steroidobacteraceae bacterium]
MNVRGALASSGVLSALSGWSHAETPMSYLHTYGPAGDPITQLGWGLGIVSIAVIVVIAVLLLGGLFHRRSGRVSGGSELAVPREGGGMAWLYAGVGISTVVLIACMGWTLATSAAISRPPTTPALTVQVTASQWWWSLRYTSPDASRTFITANEIHIPVGQPVRFELASLDVIHSFWVPALGGKMDVIPGQTNVTWLQADKPGVYRGQCAVFCGAEHARMALEVIADTPREFRAWQDDQLREPTPSASTTVLQGQRVFQARCAACHSIRGSDAAGILGPDLSHLMSRRTLAAGVLANTPGNLAGWIADPQGLKPGAQMPDHLVSGPDLAAVVGYLNTLQ